MEDFSGAIGIVFRRRKELEFLIIYNIKTGNLTFPAGGREKKETSLDTVQREVLEETGYEKHDYTIKSTDIVNTFIYKHNKTNRAGLAAKQPVYILEIISKKEPSPKDQDVSIDGWYNYKAARERLTFDDSKKILDKIMNLIK